VTLVPISSRTLTVLLAILAVVWTAPMATAEAGTISIKGKWFSGFDPDPNDPAIFSANELKAKCKDIGGPQLYDASVLGQRTITLHFHADCFVYADACETCGSGSPPPTAELVFTGEELVIEKNGNPKPFRVFSGVLTSPVYALGSMQGSIAGKMKCKNPFDAETCTLEKGTITYSRLQPDPGSGPDVRKVFIGKYKAKFE
jgi:hypothetical protein